MPEPAIVVQEEVQDTSVLDDSKLDEALFPPAEEKKAEETTDGEPAKPVEKLKPAEKKEGEAAGKEGTQPTEEEKLAKQKTDKEAFIARQKEERDRLEKEIQLNANRIGELRKRAAQLRAEAKESGDTVETTEKMISAHALEREAKETEDRGAVAMNRQAVTALHPDFETLMPEMQEVIKSHLSALGKPDGDIQAIAGDFAKNPYAVPPAILSNLAEAAKARVEAKTLRGEMDKLRKENDDLKKKGDEALKKVAKAAEGASILSAKAAGTKTGAGSLSDISADQIAELSDEQLKVLLSEQKESEKGG